MRKKQKPNILSYIYGPVKLRRLQRGWKSATASSLAVPTLAYAGLFIVDPKAATVLHENTSNAQLLLLGASNLIAANLTSVFAQHVLKEGNAERSSFFQDAEYGFIDGAYVPRAMRRLLVATAATTVTATFFIAGSLSSSLDNDNVFNSDLSSTRAAPQISLNQP